MPELRKKIHVRRYVDVTMIFMLKIVVYLARLVIWNIFVKSEIAKLVYFRHKIAYCFKGIARKQKAKKKPWIEIIDYYELIITKSILPKGLDSTSVVNI